MSWFKEHNDIGLTQTWPSVPLFVLPFITVGYIQVAGRLAFPVTFAVQLLQHTSCPQKPYSSYRTSTGKGIMGSLSILKGHFSCLFFCITKTLTRVQGDNTQSHIGFHFFPCVHSLALMSWKCSHEATDVQPKSRGGNGSSGHATAN